MWAILKKEQKAITGRLIGFGLVFALFFREEFGSEQGLKNGDSPVRIGNLED